MSQWTLGKRIAVGLLLVLAQALSVGVYALWISVQSARQLQQVSSEYVPEMQLASQLERDLFSARINFIYFVTIEKEGSLEKGWPRAEQLNQLRQQLIQRFPNLLAAMPPALLINENLPL